MKLLFIILSRLIDFLKDLFKLRKKKDMEKRVIDNMAFKIYSNIFAYDSKTLCKKVSDLGKYAQKYSVEFNTYYPSKKIVIDLPKYCDEFKRLYGYEYMPEVPKGGDFDIYMGMALDMARKGIRNMLKSDFEFN